MRYESDGKLSTYQAAPTEFSRQEKPVLFCQNSNKKKKAPTKIKCALLLTKKIPLALIFCPLPFCKARWPSGMLFLVSLRASTHFIYNTQADFHCHKIRQTYSYFLGLINFPTTDEPPTSLHQAHLTLPKTITPKALIRSI